MGLELDPRLSVGNVVTILVLLVTVAGSWFGMYHTVSATSSQLVALQTQSEAQRSEFMAAIADQRTEFGRLVADHEARLRAIEVSQATLRSELSSIATGVDRVEAGVKFLQENRPWRD